MGKNGFSALFNVIPREHFKRRHCSCGVLRDNRISPQQVQDFYPTPGTIATCMYYTGIDPRTMEKVYVPKAYEKSKCKGRFYNIAPENHKLVQSTDLGRAGRFDWRLSKCLMGGYKNGKDFRRKSTVPKSRTAKEEVAKLKVEN